jgi:DNA-binding transcriptional LysR family regulator
VDKLHAMATFVRIAERGSPTRAAESLGTSALGRAHAGRSNAKLACASSTALRGACTHRRGLALPSAVRTILAAVRDADAVAARQAEPQGRLSVTAPVLFGRRYVVPVITSFLARHPAVSAEVLLLDRRSV